MGNFLGTPALEAYNLIESLVGIPPTDIVKTDITLEDVVKRLISLEEGLPNILGNASQINGSIESINKRITTLEASNTNDNRSLRIGKLEEAMVTLSSIFSSLGFKKDNAFVGREKKFMYVPKLPKPTLHDMFKIDKTFSATKNDLHAESSIGVSKVPTSASCVLKEVYNVDASPLDNT